MWGAGSQADTPTFVPCPSDECSSCVTTSRRVNFMARTHGVLGREDIRVSECPWRPCRAVSLGPPPP